jgi:multiple sugar transport system substrate-binding protein
MGRVAWKLCVLAFVLAAAAVGAGCGGDDGGGGARTLKWYVFAEPSGAFQEAASNCTKQANGRYKVELVDLPTNADQQRELVVRRLAAEDSDIDIIGMDVIWTAEFSEAKWIKEITGRARERAEQGVLPGPLETAKYRGRLWTVPFTTNTQLLWYRKDLVKQVPKTWDEMIDQAERLDTTIQVQAARYEGLVVWFNSLVASAGGEIVNDAGDPVLGPPAVQAAEVMKRLASSSAAPPALTNNREDQARLGFESGASAFQVNYTFVYASAKTGAEGNPTTKKVFDNMGWARWPSVDEGTPSRVTLGGINLGIGAYSKNPDLATEAALCLAEPDNQVIAAEKGGLPPTNEALYEDDKIKQAFPFADLLRDTLADGAPRPVTPAYSDISLAIQQTLHPPQAIAPQKTIEDLKDNIETVSDGGIF